MEEKYDVFDFEFTPQEMAAIAALDTRRSLFFDHRDPEVVKRLVSLKRPV